MDQYSASQPTTGSWIDRFNGLTDKDFMDRVFANLITELQSDDSQFLLEQIFCAPPSPPPQTAPPPHPQVSAGEVKKRKGGWSDEEHRGFMEGHRLHPYDWKKISADYVPTRTNTQIASHHQKFVMGLAATGRKRGRKPSKKR